MGARIRRWAVYVLRLFAWWPCSLLWLLPVAQAQLGPQTVVREFCRLDALGARATLHGWPQIAPLVAWEFEPAWDRVVLVTSYTVGWPLAEGETGFRVEVRYAVTGEVTARGFRESAQIESRQFLVEPGDDGSWRIAGPPPPPHVFANDVDVAGMQRSLERGGVNFLPNSLFVWQLFRDSGWGIPMESTAELARTQVFRSATEGNPADLVLYLDGEVPYHVAVLEEEGVVVSSTLNAGIVRTPEDAFPGLRRYLRLRPPELWPATPTPTLSAAALEGLLPTVQATPSPKGTGSSLRSSPTRTHRAKERRRRKP